MANQAPTTPETTPPTATAIARLQREIKDITQSPPVGVRAAPLREDDMMHWQAVIDGPPGTPYEGGKFVLLLEFPSNYPFKPPKVSFKTPVYHCNVAPTGGICLDTLQTTWAASLTAAKVLLTVIALMCEPNPSSPMNADAAGLHKTNRKAHDDNVRDWVKKHATMDKAKEALAAIEAWRTASAKEEEEADKEEEAG